MRQFELPVLLKNLARTEMQSNYGKWGQWNYRVKQEVLSQLRRVAKVCSKSGLTGGPAATALARRIEKNDKQIVATLGGQISALRNEIVRGVDSLVYLEIPASDIAFFEPSGPLFGDKVHQSFKSSRYDIAEAGKCLALDRSTAAVMHLMRALEPALLAMAKEVNHFPALDVWGKIIEEIQNRINPKHASYINDRSKRIFLSPAAVQFQHFKDAWRDHAMHAREKYTPEEARTAYRAVEAFMTHLAKRIKE